MNMSGLSSLLRCSLLTFFVGICTGARLVRYRSLGIEGPNFVLTQDGKNETVQIHSGEIHYFRVPEVYWRDRLLRAQAMGLNTVSTYVPWNFHEPKEGEFDFTSERKKLTRFVQVADSLGLLVIVRAGPYICAEWDFGGLPSWLLKYVIKDGLKFRTSDPKYLSFVRRWWNALLPQIKPLLLEQGGPVAMVQIENEFGHFGNANLNGTDQVYFDLLVSMARTHLGPNVLLITADSAWNIRDGSGTRPGLLAGVDMGPWWEPKTHLARLFNASSQHNKGGPELLMELWSGWFQTWGQSPDMEAHFRMGGQNLTDYVEELLHRNSSFSLYMAHGGTNFGFWNAGTLPTRGKDSVWRGSLVTTSYDYAAPISEEGNHGVGGDGVDKYASLQKLLIPRRGQWEPPLPKEPAPPRLASYPGPLPGGGVSLTKRTALHDPAVLAALCDGGWQKDPSGPNPMEMYGQAGGLILYRLHVSRVETAALVKNASAAVGFLQRFLQRDQDVKLKLKGRDRITVWTNNTLLQQAKMSMVYDGIFGNLSSIYIGLPLSKESPNLGQLDVLVEHLGRGGYVNRRAASKPPNPESFQDWKGLQGAWIGNAELRREWQVCKLPLAEFPPRGRPAPKPAVDAKFEEVQGPSFFEGAFTVNGEPADTFLRLQVGMWTTGVAYVNGFNLGRYMRDARGPFDFYVPKSALHTGTNQVVLLEMDPSVNLTKASANIAFAAKRGSMLPP